MAHKYDDLSNQDLKEKLEREEVIYKLNAIQAKPIKKFFTALGKQTSVWVVSVLIALISVFSDSFTEKIKINLNKANIKTTEYEKIANNFSQYIFAAELIAKFYKTFSSDPTYIQMIANEYNDYITEIRKTEYVHLALVKKYSGDLLYTKYKELMEEVKVLDNSIHALNPVASQIIKNPKDSVLEYNASMLSKVDSMIPIIDQNIKSVTQNTEWLLMNL